MSTDGTGLGVEWSAWELGREGETGKGGNTRCCLQRDSQSQLLQPGLVITQIVSYIQ